MPSDEAEPGLAVLRVEGLKSVAEGLATPTTTAVEADEVIELECALELDLELDAGDTSA